MRRARVSSGGGGRWVTFGGLGDLDADGAELVEASCPVGGMPYSSTGVDGSGHVVRVARQAIPTQASSLAMCRSLVWGSVPVPGFEVGGVGEFGTVAGQDGAGDLDDSAFGVD